MGHVKQDKQASAMTELGRIEQTCRAGRNAEALAALQALQRRMGFRLAHIPEKWMPVFR